MAQSGNLSLAFGFDRQAALLALGGSRVGTVATHFLPPGMPGFAQACGVKGTGADFLAAPAGNASLASAYSVTLKPSCSRLVLAISEIACRCGCCRSIVPSAQVAVCPNVGWTRDFADGQTFLDPTFNGQNIQPQGNVNVSQLNDPAVNKAIDAAKTQTNPAARASAWGNVDRRITADAPVVPLVCDRVSMASSSDVDAVANDNLGVWDLAFTGLR